MMPEITIRDPKTAGERAGGRDVFRERERAKDTASTHQ